MMDESQFQDDDDREDYGIEAIIFLLGLVGYVENVQDARGSWRGMDEEEQTKTLQAYETLKKMKPIA